MKMRNKSPLLLLPLILGSLALAGNVIATSLNVETINHTTKTFSARECISGCANFTLGASPVFELIPQPSSGTATLSAFFVDTSSSSLPVSCSKNYNVATASAAVVNVRSSSGTIHCAINIQ